MEMHWIYILLAIVAIIQIAIFIMARRIRRREKENNVLLKYNINSRQRAWQLLADPDIPEKDKIEIQKYYDGE
jgi:heme/copper-type cytochrome/quinol oxidase subunit 2